MYIHKSGFTLIEILLVVAAIGILAGIVILAINPSKQLGDTRNAQRYSDVRAILDSVYQYALDHNGGLPSTVPTGSGCGFSVHRICHTGTSCSTINLSDYLVSTTAKYLVKLPIDPSFTSSSVDTGYEIYKDSTTNRVTVCAPLTEEGKIIEMSR